jgi:NAD-dependent SIR2 family protein deacetylase
VIDTLENTLRKSKKLLFLTGAGISQESGIATFRGTDGLCLLLRKIGKTRTAIMIDSPNHYGAYDQTKFMIAEGFRMRRNTVKDRNGEG